MDAPDSVRPMIGLSPRLLRQVPPELGFRGKTLQYLEQSVASWVMAQDAIAVMIPSVIRDTAPDETSGSAREFASRLDGLVLQGGADIHPSCYGQPAHYAESITDVIRDVFELRLLREFIAAGKPVLGICRGMQLINVLFGGSLHQDLLEAQASRDPHVIAGAEETYRHGLMLEAGGWLSRLHGDTLEAQVNSIHHQGVDRLGEGLRVEARSHDGVVEAIRAEQGFVVGVQWHPEFHDLRFPDLLPSQPLMTAFLDEARAVRAGGRPA
jgi:gamma-glutamyl-gamma-aminobutyrate hydrolase PuuD